MGLADVNVVPSPAVVDLVDCTHGVHIDVLDGVRLLAAQANK